MNMEQSKSNRPRLSAEQIKDLNQEHLLPYLIRLAVILPIMIALHFFIYISTHSDPTVYLAGFPVFLQIWAHIWIPFLAVVVLGFLMSGLMVLAHEMSHGHLIAHTPINLVVGMLMAVPLAVPYPLYGLSHKRHHTYNTTKRDPSYYEPPKNPIIRMFAWLFHYMQLSFAMSVLFALDKLSDSEKIGAKNYPFRIFLTVVEAAIIVSLMFILGWKLFLLHYFLPWLSFSIWNTTRAIGEHEYLYDGEDGHKRQIETTRSMYMGPITKFFWWKAGYHIEHHLYPSIPFHNLDKVQKYLGLELQTRPTYLQYMLYRWKRGVEYPMFL